MPVNGTPAHTRVTKELAVTNIRCTVNGVDFTGDPCRVVDGTFNGRWLKAGERVWAALFAFQAWLDKHHPGLYVYVIQSAYHEGYAPSAGTHDRDRVLDVAVINRRTGRRVWLRARRWFRRSGWACWWRHTGSWWKPSSYHLHQVLLGGSCPVGYLVPGQIDDYYHHKTGLVGHLLEPGWYPKDIDATVFDFDAWLREMEDDMPAPKDWDAKDWAAVREHLADAVLDAPLNAKSDGEAAFKDETVRSGLKRLLRPLLGKKA